MAQTVTISKSSYDELLNRLERLEKAVFTKGSVMRSIQIYNEEKQKGKLKKLKKIDDLFE